MSIKTHTTFLIFGPPEIELIAAFQIVVNRAKLLKD